MQKKPPCIYVRMEAFKIMFGYVNGYAFNLHIIRASPIITPTFENPIDLYFEYHL